MVSQSLWQRAWQNFKQNRWAYFSLWGVGFLAFIALIADFLAYNKPFYAVYQGKTYFPIFRDYGEALGLTSWPAELKNVDWRGLSLEKALWPLVRYAPSDIDLRNVPEVGPFDAQVLRTPAERHYLGTDHIGRDVLSGLLHGTRISLTVGIVSVGISALIGILLGALAGYFGDNRVQVSRAGAWLGMIGIAAGVYYGFYLRRYKLAEALGEGALVFLFQLLVSLVIGAIVGVLVWSLSRLFKRTSWGSKKVYLWIDITISRVIEIMISIPTTLLIFTIAAIAKPSLFLVMAVIGLTSWTGIARFMRGEMLKVRNLEYIQAAQALGYPAFRTIFIHAIPNALAPVLVSIAFGIASAILVESGLSYLGIGVPITTVTWGALLSSARNALGAWWLAVFPGIAIFVTVTLFNILGEGLRDALDPKLQSL
ncbi:MAG: ABC transporter permease [Bacteroidia bacterium]